MAKGGGCACACYTPADGTDEEGIELVVEILPPAPAYYSISTAPLYTRQHDKNLPYHRPSGVQTIHTLFQVELSLGAN